MLIQVNFGDVQSSEAIEARVREEVSSALEHQASRVTRVEVHLRDLNGQKAGIDKRCTMEARLAGFQPLAVEEDREDLYDAIHAAAKKLHRAVKHKLERHEEHKNS